MAVTDHDAHAWVEVWFAGMDGFRSTRRRVAATSTARTAPRRSRSMSPGSRTCSGRAWGCSSLAVCSATSWATAASGSGGGAGASSGDIAKARGGGSSARGFSVARVVVAGLAALVLLLVAAKLLFRWSRFLTGDPRAIATACRRELVAYLLDVGITIPRNLGVAELGEVVLKRTGVDSGRLVQHMGLARFGPPGASADAARAAKSELRAVRRRLARGSCSAAGHAGSFFLRPLFAS